MALNGMHHLCLDNINNQVRSGCASSLVLCMASHPGIMSVLMHDLSLNMAPWFVKL